MRNGGSVTQKLSQDIRSAISDRNTSNQNHNLHKEKGLVVIRKRDVNINGIPLI